MTKHVIYAEYLALFVGLCLTLYPLSTSRADDFWPTEPDWVSPDTLFTMSVALADLDLDGRLDLVTGNYSYPYNFSGSPHNLQEGDIGWHLVGYRWNSSDSTFDNSTNFTDLLRCIDCIALADYDRDGDIDIAFGAVVGKGGDGGVWVLKNKRVTSYYPPPTFANLFAESFSEHPDDSYDCHCVRWADVNNDGRMDLATLEVGGLVRIYINQSDTSFSTDPIKCDLGPSCPYPANTSPTYTPGERDDPFSAAPLPYAIPGTTMEFGDMDHDGDLDLFVNVAGIPRVYINSGTGDFYSPSNFWEADAKEDMFCASFGFYDGDTTLALAIGSRALSNPDGHHPFCWRNDIYKLVSGRLQHVWQSIEYPGRTPKTQYVSDIQWAFMGDSSDQTMDLITAAYGICDSVDGNGYVIWDTARGLEMYYADPSDSDSCAWQSSTIDLSTSLALGDVDGLGNVQGRISIDSANYGDDTRLFYASRWPFYKVDSLRFYHDSTSMSSPLPPYAYDTQNGWISVADTLFPTNWDSMVIYYRYSRQLDLAVGNDGFNVLYFYNDNEPSRYDYDPPDPQIIIAPIANPHHYNPDDYGISPTDSNLNLMEPDGLGATHYGTGMWDFDAPPPDQYASDHPDVKRIGLEVSQGMETFQGHYFWDWTDKMLNALYEEDKNTFIYDWAGPPWAPSDINDNFYIDYRLKSMYIRNLVNRYRPYGVYGQNNGWGDWGADIFQMLNEPNGIRSSEIPRHNDPKIETIARYMFYNYQMIKEIQEGAYADSILLQMATPNWGGYCPMSPDTHWTWLDSAEYWSTPMPYLNQLNATQLPDIPDSYDRVLWYYTDYICLQSYNPHDPFALAYADTAGLLKLGVEHLFWSYYTPGMADYYGNPEGHDFSPVMKIDNTHWSEHPFLVFEWTFERDWWNEADEGVPKSDFTAAEIAELFTVDVFPTNANKDHCLLKYDLPWLGMDPRYTGLVDDCAQLLNDPYPNTSTGNPITGTHVHPEIVTTFLPDSTDPEVFRYTYHYDNNITDRYIHFLKTEWKFGPGRTMLSDSMYVIADPNGWDFDYLGLDYSCAGGTPKVDCYTASGAQFQKDVDSSAGGEYVHFTQGEMGPGMLIMHENETDSQTDYGQTICLHPGWNLVSWHLRIEDPDSIITNYLAMNEILDSTNTWFFADSDNAVYKYDVPAPHNYPDESGSDLWEWNRRHAYYIYLENFHPWQYTNLPVLDSIPFTISPDAAWDQSLDSLNYAREWFFMGYACPGLEKLASVPDTEQTASGDPAFFSYEGPFHWLIWEENEPHHYPIYDLKIIKTDDGKVYVPTPAQFNRVVDQIGVLEPGRGYFLGFATDSSTQTYNFAGWSAEPIWQNNALPPNPNAPGSQIASSAHFQFKPYTHWFYPVMIDTVDLQETPMALGDEIGVFDGEICVGSAQYAGAFPMILACWEDDIATPDELDGYTDNNDMTFIWYDVSSNTEAEFIPPPGTLAAEEDDQIAPTHSGFGAGFYAMRSFAYGVGTTIQLPQEYKLCQNFPNPFNSATVIPLELPQRSQITLDLFNVRGQKVATLYEGVQNAGWPKIRYDASRLASGMYFYRLIAKGLERGGRHEDVGKMLVLK